MAAGAWFARGLRRWRVPHRVYVDNRGIELCWADEGAPTEPISEAIGWEELRGITDADSYLLLNLRGGDFVEIPDRTFSLNTKELRQTLLDEVADRAQAGRRATAEVTAYFSERYAKNPVELRLRTDPAAKLPRSSVGPELLRLTKNGFGYGRSPEPLEWIPWPKLRFARVHTVGGEPWSVRVGIEGGARIELRGDYGITLRQLALSLLPPPELRDPSDSEQLFDLERVLESYRDFEAALQNIGLFSPKPGDSKSPRAD